MFEGCTSLIGAIYYDASKTDVSMANPEFGYFTKVGSSSILNVKDDKCPEIRIYNLHAIRIKNNHGTLPAGIYIMNGKKRIVKH